MVVALQAPVYIANIQGQFGYAIHPTMYNTTFLGISLSCSFIINCRNPFIMWLGERITDKGIGNGISMIIMIGIIARFPFALRAEFISRISEMNGGLSFL